MSDGPDWIRRVGMTIVGVAAVVWSFTALTDLAELLGVRQVIATPLFDVRIAWGLPAVVDVFAILATREWLKGRGNPEALAFARRAMWVAVAATVAGNGYHGYLTGGARLDVVLVSAVPAVAMGALVHLVVLVGRRSGDEPVEVPAVQPWAGLLDDVLAEPWDRAVTDWAKAVDDTGHRVPTRDEPDHVLAADLRAVGLARRRPLVQDEVRERYGVGATRAARLRELAASPAPPIALVEASA